MGLVSGRAILLLDTCGERASVAVAREGEIAAEKILMERTASGALLGVIRDVFEQAGIAVRTLDGIGVVNGPGSFTGLRVGLAMAKGLCEATGVRMAAVSRLAVLADASGIAEGVAVLWAGRDQMYVRDIGGGSERLVGASHVAELYEGSEVAFAEEDVVPWLTGGLRPKLVNLSAGLSLRLVVNCLADGGSDVARVDANYVRNEETIYLRHSKGS